MQNNNQPTITTTNYQTIMITTTAAQATIRASSSMQRKLRRSNELSATGGMIQASTFRERGREAPSAPKKQHRVKLVHLNYPSHVIPDKLAPHERTRFVEQIDRNWSALYADLGRANPPTKKDELPSPSYSECSGRAVVDDYDQVTIPSAPLAPPTLKSILKKKNVQARSAKSASFGETVFHMDYFGVEDLLSEFNVTTVQHVLWYTLFLTCHVHFIYSRL